MEINFSSLGPFLNISVVDFLFGWVVFQIVNSNSHPKFMRHKWSSKTISVGIMPKNEMEHVRSYKHVGVSENIYLAISLFEVQDMCYHFLRQYKKYSKIQTKKKEFSLWNVLNLQEHSTWVAQIKHLLHASIGQTNSISDTSSQNVSRMLASSLCETQQWKSWSHVFL